MKTFTKLLLLLFCASCATDYENGNEMTANKITDNQLHFSVDAVDETITYKLGVFTFDSNETLTFDDPVIELTLKGDVTDVIEWRSKVASFALVIYDCDNLRYSTEWKLYKDGQLFEQNEYSNN